MVKADHFAKQGDALAAFAEQIAELKALLGEISPNLCTLLSKLSALVMDAYFDSSKIGVSPSWPFQSSDAAICQTIGVAASAQAWQAVHAVLQQQPNEQLSLLGLYRTWAQAFDAAYREQAQSRDYCQVYGRLLNSWLSSLTPSPG